MFKNFIFHNPNPSKPTSEPITIFLLESSKNKAKSYGDVTLVWAVEERGWCGGFVLYALGLDASSSIVHNSVCFGKCKRG
jgi:hypothetical protein